MLILLLFLSFLIRLWKTLLYLPLGNLFNALVYLHNFLILLDSEFVLAMFDEESIKSLCDSNVALLRFEYDCVMR